jgi:hypothetical protein
MRRVAVLIAVIAAACTTASIASPNDGTHCVSYPEDTPQTYISGAVGQDVFLTEACSRGNSVTLTYTAEPSGVSVTVRMAGSFRTDPVTGATRFLGTYAIVHVAGGQIIDAGQIDYGFPVDYKGRFDSAPELEFASYTPVVQAFVLLLGAP